ncbi:hypothetical protein FHS96_001757 [Sphingomonas zeicaulis]|uniref:hypothetical protein n=1 Tax=Sphingomonas zeicaulis TaxID=1632740 RepID=UPI003D19B7E1
MLGHHIPLVGFDNRKGWAHQTDNAPEVYALLAGRKALDLSGHSHTLENLAPGDPYKGWKVPATLAPGIHTATVSVTRPQGWAARETLIFEVRPERPARTFRFDVWNPAKDGPRVPE